MAWSTTSLIADSIRIYGAVSLSAVYYDDGRIQFYLKHRLLDSVRLVCKGWKYDFVV